LSNNDESLPFLVDKLQEDEISGEGGIEDKIFHLSKVPSVVKILEDFDIEQNPN
jgi:hypothetical protein